MLGDDPVLVDARKALLNEVGLLDEHDILIELEHVYSDWIISERKKKNKGAKSYGGR